MSIWRNITLTLAIVGLLIFAVLIWYKSHYSMDIAPAITVTVPDAKHHLLIATQGSTYKNNVVEGVIKAAKLRQMTVQVIDVSALSTVDVGDWSAMVILHTWESWEPQMDAKLFAQRHTGQNNIIFLSTSGQGDLAIPGVDAITSASSLADVPKHVAEIVARIDAAITNFSG
ncbi:MAG: hypothetical protein ACI8Z9_002651 [Paraglaciecola sp.]|jgi:hypothetical protein